MSFWFLHTLKFASREKVELGLFVTRIFGLEGWRLQLFLMPSLWDSVPVPKADRSFLANFSERNEWDSTPPDFCLYGPLTSLISLWISSAKGRMHSAAGPALGVETQEAPEITKQEPSRSWSGTLKTGCSEKTEEKLLPSFGWFHRNVDFELWAMWNYIYTQKGFVMPNLVSIRYYIIYTLGHKKRKKMLRSFSGVLFQLQRERKEDWKWKMALSRGRRDPGLTQRTFRPSVE